MNTQTNRNNKREKSMKNKKRETKPYKESKSLLYKKYFYVQQNEASMLKT